MGGVFNVVNLHVYHYAGNNPVKYTDPDGRSLLGKLSAGACFVGAALVLAAGTAIVATTAGTTAVIIAPAALKLSAELAGAGVLLAAVDEASEYAGQKLKQRAQAVAPAPVPNGPDDNNKEKNTKKTSTNQMNQQIKKGQAPKDIERVDKADTNVKGSQNHVHFKDGTSMNQDGTIHDAHKGTPNPSKEAVEWLKNNGWNIE